MSVAAKFMLFGDYWSPKSAGTINDSYVKLVSVKGELVWDNRKEEDEVSLLVIGFPTRDRDVDLWDGEFLTYQDVLSTTCI